VTRHNASVAVGRSGSRRSMLDLGGVRFGPIYGRCVRRRPARDSAREPRPPTVRCTGLSNIDRLWDVDARCPARRARRGVASPSWTRRARRGRATPVAWRPRPGAELVVAADESRCEWRAWAVCLFYLRTGQPSRGGRHRVRGRVTGVASLRSSCEADCRELPAGCAIRARSRRCLSARGAGRRAAPRCVPRGFVSNEARAPLWWRGPARLR
jgi:hypothetical protein